MLLSVCVCVCKSLSATCYTCTYLGASGSWPPVRLTPRVNVRSQHSGGPTLLWPTLHLIWTPKTHLSHAQHSPAQRQDVCSGVGLKIKVNKRYRNLKWMLHGKALTTSSWNNQTYLAVIKLDSKLGIWASRGRSVWTNHGRSHSGLTVLPEGVLTEDKVGQVERKTCSLPDAHLQQRDKQTGWS